MFSSTEKLGGLEATLRVAAFLNQQEKLYKGRLSCAVMTKVEDIVKKSVHDISRWKYFMQLTAEFQTVAEENKKSTRIVHKMDTHNSEAILLPIASAFADPRAYSVSRLEQCGRRALSFSTDASALDCVSLFSIFIEKPNLLQDLALLEKKNLKIPRLIILIFKDYTNLNLEGLTDRLQKLSIDWRGDGVSQFSGLLEQCRNLTASDWDKAYRLFEAWRTQNTKIVMHPVNASVVLHYTGCEGFDAIIDEKNACRAEFVDELVVDNTAEERINLQIAMSKLPVVTEDQLRAIVLHVKKCAAKTSIMRDTGRYEDTFAPNRLHQLKSTLDLLANFPPVHT